MQNNPTEEYLHTVDLKPKSIYIVHETMERHLPLHAHQKGQLTYVEGGIAYILTEKKTYYIPSRHYVWIPKGLAHIVKVRSSATVIRNLYFYADDDGNDPFYQRLGIYPVSTLLMEMIAFTSNWSGFIEEKDSSYHFFAAIKNILPPLSTKSYPIALPTTINAKLRPIVLYLAQNFSANITLESISNRFGIGERTLSRLFQSDMDISFFQYLKLLRIVKAIEMILEDEHSTSEIAYLTGYNSLAAFSKAFYQLTNIRPSDFGKNSV